MTPLVPIIVPVAKIVLAVFCLGWAFTLCRQAKLTLTDADGDETLVTSWPLIGGSVFFAGVGLFIVVTLPA